jgi:N6-adenosine-specific RNA methylase IME4
LAELRELPNAGLYRLVAADPPYRFEVRSRATGLGRSPDCHYRTMDPAAIGSLPVASIVAPDCWLMLWTTWPFLPKAFEIATAWGFHYSSRAFVWAKLNPRVQPNLFGFTENDFALGLGYTVRGCDEPCLLFRRGSPQRISKSVRSLIIEPRREHSRKPEAFYSRAEAFAPGPRLELFARQRRAGWDCWGDEIGKFDDPSRKVGPVSNSLIQNL